MIRLASPTIEIKPEWLRDVRAACVTRILDLLLSMHRSNPLHAVEVGCAFKSDEGLSTFHIASRLRNHRSDARFISIEHSPGHVESARRLLNSMTGGRPLPVEFRIGHSLSVLPSALEELRYVDFALLDGGAHPEVCLREFELIAAHLSDSGAILVDDLQELAPSEAYPFPRPFGKGSLILPLLNIAHYLRNRERLHADILSCEAGSGSQTSRALDGIADSLLKEIAGDLTSLVISDGPHKLLAIGRDHTLQACRSAVYGDPVLQAEVAQRATDDDLVRARAEKFAAIHERRSQTPPAPGGELALEFPGFRMLLDPADKGSLYTLCSHEAGILESFERFLFAELLRLNPGCSVVDVGANYGLYTLTACGLKREYGITGIIAAEPDRRVAATLEKSLAVNGYAEDVIVVQKAVTSRDHETVTLFLNAGGSPDNRISAPGTIPVSTSYPVETITVDSLVRILEERRGTPKGTVVKMDIQGAEPEALAGCAGLLNSPRPIAVLFEFTPSMMESAGHSPEEFIGAIFSAGFEAVFEIDELHAKLRACRNAEEMQAILMRCRSVQDGKDPRRYTNFLCTRGMRVPARGGHDHSLPRDGSSERREMLAKSD